MRLTIFRRIWAYFGLAVIYAGFFVSTQCHPVEAPPGISRDTTIVNASRIFAGPNQYPPREFAAYGILAFPSRPSPADRDRYLMICNEYVAVLPDTRELSLPRAKQMVTVWPLNSDYSDHQLSKAKTADICEFSVAHYGLVTAQQALKDAELAGANTTGIGPFLLAWSPSTDKGKRDVLVLVSDLSNLTTSEQAREIFLAWTHDIEEDPSLWSKGWGSESLRTYIRFMVDKYGETLFRVFGVKGWQSILELLTIPCALTLSRLVDLGSALASG